MANLPTFLSKSFKLTSAAKEKMASTSTSQDRLCDLDPNSQSRVLVYRIGGPDAGFDDLHWSQRSLYEAAQKDPSLRISKKAINNETFIEIKQHDKFNPAELERYKDQPNMTSTIAAINLGFFQSRQHKYIYIVSTMSGG